MAKEQSIKDQISAMIAWALEVSKKEEQKNYDGARELLKNIQVQTRRMEWRGSKSGLKHLEKTDEVKELKRKITEVRVATGFLAGAIGKVQKLAKKEIKAKTDAEKAAIRQSEQGHFKTIGKYTHLLESELLNAKNIFEEAGLDKAVESDPNLEDFNNPQTLLKIKILMEAHNMYALKAFQREHANGVRGYYGDPEKKEGGGIIQISVKNETKWHIEIDLGALYASSVIPSGWRGSYNTGDRGKYSSFKAYLTRFFKIVDDAVQGRSTEDIEKRLGKEGFY